MTTKYYQILLKYLQDNDGKGDLTGYSMLLEKENAPYYSPAYCREICYRAERRNMIIYHKGKISLTNHKKAIQSALKQNQTVIERQRKNVEDRDKKWKERRKIQSQL